MGEINVEGSHRLAKMVVDLVSVFVGIDYQIRHARADPSLSLGCWMTGSA